MNVFLVRHAESADSRDNWPTPQSPLSDFGRQQSQALSSLSRFRLIDTVMSSKWTRAKETARIVAKKLGKPLELIEGIHEREQSKKIYGSKFSGKISQEYIAGSTANLDNLDWRFSRGEESLREVSQRAAIFKKHIEKEHLSQNLLVISHDVFIRSFACICILGSNYQDETFNKVFRSLYLTNTGVSLLVFSEKSKRWKLWYWNDFSHFKNIKIGKKAVSGN